MHGSGGKKIPLKLESVAQSLLTALKNSGDKRLTSYCAEYLVALKLIQKRHDVDVLQKRRGPDIYLKDLERYIEVKSGHSDLSDWSCSASFGTGKSIKNNKFDYCVFLGFPQTGAKGISDFHDGGTERVG